MANGETIVEHRLDAEGADPLTLTGVTDRNLQEITRLFGTRVVIVPITSNVDSLYPGEALVRVKGKPARALGDQIRSVGQQRLRGRVARLTVDELREVERAVRITFGLGAP